MTTALDTYFRQYQPALEAKMRELMPAIEGPWAGLFGMLRYHLGWANASFEPEEAAAGKQLRPVLCLLACEACGGNWHEALPAAVAVELAHNFSLIHDDIEDGDRVRRGRPTVWALWDQPQAINAGDAMFMVAELAILRLTALNAATALEAVKVFNRACLSLTQGQYLDIGFEQQDSVSVDEYLTMVEGKTAALLACTCELGALIATRAQHDTIRDRQRAQLRAFGWHLGMAFQMQDDVLGIWGDPRVTGKPASSDLARRKKSLPILHGLEHSAQLRTLLDQPPPLLPEVIAEATALLETTDSRGYTERAARQHHEQALEALAATTLMEPTAEALRALAEQLVGRTK